jgi:CBS-domain-containing membrane protein
MKTELSRMPIHVRRVLERDGEVGSENEIYCLASGASVAVSQCEGCGDYAGTDLDLGQHRSYLLCRRMSPELAVAFVPPAPHALLRRRLLGTPTPPQHARLSEIMTADVWCVREDVDLAPLCRLFATRPVGGVPVIDHQARCVGVISRADVLRARGVEQRVSELMSRLTFTLPPDASVGEAAALMALEGIHQLPIVTADGRVAGMVSSMDVMRWLARQAGYVVPSCRCGECRPGGSEPPGPGLSYRI